MRAHLHERVPQQSLVTPQSFASHLSSSQDPGMFLQIVGIGTRTLVRHVRPSSLQVQLPCSGAGLQPFSYWLVVRRLLGR